MKLRRHEQQNIIENISSATSVLKEAMAHAYVGGRFDEKAWNTALVQRSVGLAITDLSRAVNRLGHPGEAARLENEGYALAFREDAHYQPNARAEPDEHAAQELYLYLTNTFELYGPGSMGAMIERRYAKLYKKGFFDPEKAAKGYDYLVTEAAKRYMKEQGSPGQRWHDTFNVPTRRLVSDQLVDDFVSEAKLGNFRG